MSGLTLNPGLYGGNPSLYGGNAGVYGGASSLINPDNLVVIPVPVSNLVATTVDDTSVQLTFTPVAGATSYQYRVNGGTWVDCADISGSQLVTGLTANTAYTFEVRGHNVAGYSAASNTASATTFTSQAVALFARMTTPPVSARKILINTVFASLISASILTKLSALYFEAAHDAQAARLNWISASFDLAPVNSPTFTVDRGYAGDGSTSYVDTGLNPTTDALFTQNSASFGHWLNAGSSTGSGSAITMGVNTGSLSSSIILPFFTGSVIRGRANQIGSANFGGIEITTRLGFTALSRTASNTTKAYKNTTASNADTTASAAAASGNFFLGGTSSAGVLVSGSDNRHAMDFIGAALSDAEMLALYNAANTFLTTIGAN